MSKDEVFDKYIRGEFVTSKSVDVVTAHYDAVIEGYKKGIQDAIAEIIKEFNNNIDDWSYQSGLFKAKEIIEKYTGVK